MAAVRNSRSRHASFCWRYPPSVTISLFCCVAANPNVVPATELEPAASPSPAACVPFTVSLLYCAPIDVDAAMPDRLYDAVPFRLAVYVQKPYGFDVAFP